MSPTATPIPERLELVRSDEFKLLHGNHGAPDDPDAPPEACLLEAEGWIYGEEWGDCPPCVSPVLWRYGQRLNDRFTAEDRQLLKRFLGRMGGTGDDGQDDARRALAARWVINTSLPNWLELAGLTDRADELRGMEISEWTPALRDLLYEVRGEVWKKHPTPYKTLRQAVRAAVREKLKAQGTPNAAAVADAAAVAVAVADAAAVAVADAAAVAVADAVADAAAVAVAVAVADADLSPDATWSEVYAKVRNDDGVKKAIAEKIPFATEHRDGAIELFEQMLDPAKAEATE
jgi:hypothetical protein